MPLRLSRWTGTMTRGRTFSLKVGKDCSLQNKISTDDCNPSERALMLGLEEGPFELAMWAGNASWKNWDIGKQQNELFF